MEIARYWRTNSQRYTLKGTVCTRCGKLSVSSRPVCEYCQNEIVTSQLPSHQAAHLWDKPVTPLIAV